MFCLMISFVWVCIVLGVAVMCFLVVVCYIYGFGFDLFDGVLDDGVYFWFGWGGLHVVIWVCML